MTVPTNKAMPLRIALLAQPANAAELSADLLSSFPEMTTVVVDGNFNQALAQAIEAVNQGSVVKLCLESNSHSLVMLSALTAAQNKIHPHANLAGFVDTAIEGSVQLALDIARRPATDLSHQQQYSALSASQQFNKLLNMVNAISSRSLPSHYWFTEPNKARVASLTFNDDSQQSTSLILTQATGLQKPKSLLSSERLMFVISGREQAELVSQLASLRDELKYISDSADSELAIATLMQSNLSHFQSVQHNADRGANIVIQAASIEAALQEITALENALPKVMADNSHYKTPAGSCFSPMPQSKGGVAFVYPGVGTVYPGMLREFHHHFPQLFARLEREGNLKEMLQADKTYAEDTQEMSLSELAIAGVGSSYLLTQLLCEEFKVQPDFALGYSKGEASMWASLNVWKNPHALIEMTQTSPIFTTAISGELTAVRQDWQLSSDESIQWNSFVVRSDAQAIEALLPEFPRAYLAIIQGDTCVLAGCESTCRALLKKLGKRGIAANRVTAMHTTPALSQHNQVREFYTQPLFDELPKHIRFISAAGLPTGAPINIDIDSIALSIADTFCSTLDFTALIQSARQQGARLFVEVGADRQTSTLIDKINRSDNVADQYCSIASNAKGGDDIVTLIKCIGQLITHQIPLSVEPLIQGLEQQITAAKQLNGVPQSSAVNHQGELV
ncbi:PfaB family protein [Vibrio sp. 10N.261.46.E12]|uniref:PfaB family protein n=1 Tax=unclassified Vibrio TaxID=2614977 RepID=UPI0009783913|nr:MULTISPECIES: PfaB family protein [unclassified Vibrio]OMO35292.1 omega-3 polyunsaturated fatty acid synthase PfaB [Vibrio sp. 10N.261.45.E1]PMJ24487.1 omega-3 polyunsaturated fatty acid synthase PfaB [Vibrio sp. 10N.286.45.B6]PML85772.1 omega-3 polyunsaturated fatty acid synthase PfaB [Vibrio sp. 10N.261.49.E11]PMM65844.1 omega-3 polyunsaturated fatty acid synthase PfaB [Vibrio sp. 10N.261.46.F12]PMM79463.1 omega-3 polyunsaturated fatty acid synthase PfaB [Vibrio sp. 10N.261.46.E8]